VSLVVSGLTCGYAGKAVISGVNFRVEPGEMVAILGPNGVGKTTLIRAILGLMPLHSGHTRWLDGSASLPVSDVAGFVSQASSVPFGYSVLDMVLMGRARHLGLFALPGPRDRAVAMDALRRVGIGHLAERPCPALSGGEQQLVRIARALAAEPRLLVLDEPETHLDLRHRLQVMELLRRLTEEEGLAVLFSTHHPDEVLWYADQALLLFPDGEVQAVPVPDGLDDAALQRLYGTPLARMALPDDDTPPWIIAPKRWRRRSTIPVPPQWDS